MKTIGLLYGLLAAACVFGAGEPSRILGPAEAARAVPIRPGDVINVLMTEDERVRFDGEVGAAGLIQLPYLGRFSMAGKTTAAAESSLSAALEKDLYVKATVAVTLIRRAPAQAEVYGAVRQPGKVNLPQVGELTVVQAISEVGGVSTWAAPEGSRIDRVDEVTGARTRIKVDLRKAYEDVGGADNVKLKANDIVFVPSATGEGTVLSNEPSEVIVAGEVRTPGLVTFAPGEQMTFLRAIFKAGNFSRFAKTKKVKVISSRAKGTRQEREVNAERIIEEGHLEEDFELSPGDMIIVPEKRFNW